MRGLQEYEVVVPKIDIPDHDVVLRRGDRVSFRGKTEIVLSDGRTFRHPGAHGMVRSGWLAPYVPPEKRRHATAISLLESAIRR